MKITSLDEMKTTSLDELTENKGKFDSIEVVENRKNFTNKFTAALACGFLILLAVVVFWHLFYTQALLTTEESIDLLDKKILLVSDTAKTLYTFLGPLITAAISFYFNSSNRDKDSDPN